MGYVYAAYAVRVTIIRTGGKFRLLSNCTELHALTQAACSYALLLHIMEKMCGCFPFVKEELQ